MEQKKYFFAVDLGATSGRTILGSLSDGKFDLEELTRFDNRLINPDDACFANPSSMVEAIKQYCEKTGQHVPQNYGEFCRCIFESLALRYRQIFTWLKDFADFDLNVLHIIGGGSLNQYLNQFTADSCGVTVLAGPQEGTAIGNIMLQAKASGLVKDIWEMRQIIANSLELKKFEPKNKETPNGVSPSAPWDGKKSPREKNILPRDMPMDITSIFRREEPLMNTSFSTSRKEKVCSTLPIFRKQRSRLETSSCSFPVNGIPTIHQAPRDGKAIGSDSRERISTTV
jgi:sugar (pentulose or hexulose) kinase